MIEAPDKSTLRTRPSLLFRLKDWQDEAGWTEFYRLYSNLVYNFARRSGLSHADAEEVTQDVFKRVAETVHEFESNPARGTFRGWLMTLCRWRITDKFRAHKPHERQSDRPRFDLGEDDTRTIDRLPSDSNLEQTWEEEWQRQVLDTALGRLSRRVPSKHYQIFDLYTRENWAVLRLSRELGVNPAAVYLITHRLTKQLKLEVGQLQKQLQNR